MRHLKTILLISVVCAAGLLFLRPSAPPKAPASAVVAPYLSSSKESIEAPVAQTAFATVPDGTNSPAAPDICSECGQVHPGHVCAMYGGGKIMTLGDLPSGNVKSAVEKLPAEAQQHALLQLSRMNFRGEDSVRVDGNGFIYYVCTFTHAGMPEADNIPLANNAATAGETAAVPLISYAPVPITSPPIYHSKPDSTKVLFLDFNGQDISNTYWNNNSSYGNVGIWHCLPFDIDGDTNTFNDTEQRYIHEIWERVSEDYAVFDVDVTTEQPSSWNQYTAHALITPTNDANGVACPHAGAGGVAYVDVFGLSNFSYNSHLKCYSPAWITPQSYSSYSATAEAISHELGHNLGLSHDGTIINGVTNEYYHGHINGGISWAPIMGAGYGKNVTQWSKGEYYGANRFEDDLAIIASKLTYRPDDYSNTIMQAASVLTSGGVFSVTGMVGRTDDSDMFKFTCMGGTLAVTATTYRCSEGTWGGNGDLVLQLYDSGGSLLASNNPVSETTASISQTVTDGTYYLEISPTGVGNPTNSTPTGYTSYDSIGSYTIAGSVPLPDLDNDGIPDIWEQQYFGGETNADPSALASNGVNTVLGTYIAGISPVDPNAFFNTTAVAASNGFVVGWNATSGRVYSVNWTVALTNNFQALETNIVWPQSSYTDTVYSTQPNGFYNVKVRLAE